MTVVIDPTFSVLRLLERSASRNFLLRHRDTMLRISYEIENSTGVALGKTRLFAGFQQLSRFLPQVERYRAMAPALDAIYVFGVPDVEPPTIPKVSYLPLAPDDQLAREWFVVAYGPGYASALATEEVSAADTKAGERTFKGLWTYNPFIVSLIGDRLSSAVGTLPIKWDIDEVLHRQHLQRMAKSIERLIGALDGGDHRRLNDQRARLRQELTEALEQELQPTRPSSR